MSLRLSDPGSTEHAVGASRRAESDNCPFGQTEHRLVRAGIHISRASPLRDNRLHAAGLPLFVPRPPAAKPHNNFSLSFPPALKKMAVGRHAYSLHSAANDRKALTVAIRSSEDRALWRKGLRPYCVQNVRNPEAAFTESVCRFRCHAVPAGASRLIKEATRRASSALR